MSSETPRLDAILDAVRKLGGKARPKQIVEETGLGRENVQSGLKALLESGALVKRGTGNYYLPGAAAAEDEDAEKIDPLSGDYIGVDPRDRPENRKRLATEAFLIFKLPNGAVRYLMLESRWVGIGGAPEVGSEEGAGFNA